MSVANYGHRFEQLIQYVSQYHDMEEDKEKRFIRGLMPEISKYLVTLGLTVYHEVVLKALLVKREELRTRLVPSGP